MTKLLSTLNDPKWKHRPELLSFLVGRLYSDNARMRIIFFFPTIIAVASSVFINGCSRLDDLFNSQQQFHKTACTIGKLMTFEEADEACKRLEMPLYDIEDSTDESIFSALIVSVYESGTTAWINGRQNGNGRWCKYRVIR